MDIVHTRLAFMKRTKFVDLAPAHIWPLIIPLHRPNVSNISRCEIHPTFGFISQEFVLVMHSCLFLLTAIGIFVLNQRIRSIRQSVQSKEIRFLYHLNLDFIVRENR